MSGQLDLTFNHHGGSEVDGLPVVVDLVDASLETVVKPRLVRLSSGWRQDIEPGTYLVRVRFPAGKEIRRTCTVRDDERVTISIDVRDLAGREGPEQSDGPSPVQTESTTGRADTSLASAWIRRWRGTTNRRWRLIDPDAITVIRDESAIRCRFAAAPHSDSVRESNALQLGGTGIAWRFISLPAAPVVDVTVSPRGQNDLAIKVTTGSAEAEALLGYLRTGAVEGADVTAESLLQQKLRDPIAAAIGGYYLLRTANLDRLSAWGPNLSEWFPWLADGAVINGWQHIHAGREHRGDSDQHFGIARQQLIRATQRGVPAYTEGLRLLVDGLRLVRRDSEAEDAELDAALAFIEPFAMAADWSAATVTYGGVNPAKPDRNDRYGIPEHRDRLVLLQEEAKDPLDQAQVITEQARRLISRGELQQAEQLLRHARELFAAEGSEREAAMTMGVLADIALARGDDNEALRILREIRLPTLEYLGSPAAARDLYAELLPVEERVQGREHLDTLVTRFELARWTGEAGDPAAARSLYIELLPVIAQARGLEHPDTLATWSSVARWTGEAGNASAARDLYATLLQVRSRVLGPEHPGTLVTRFELARWTGRAGDPAAARDLYAELLPVEERVQGREHLDTLVTRFELARWTGRAGDPAAARDLYAELLPVEERVQGREHLSTLVTRFELARWTGEAGDPAAARDLYAELLPVEEHVRGPEDPSTLNTRDQLARWTRMADRSNDGLNVSFPYWEGAIDKLSYTLEDGRLDIVVLPGEDGLKYDGADVVFSRGAAFPTMGGADVERVRGRNGIPEMRLTVSLPLQGQQLDEISYQVAKNYLHIIVHLTGDWSLDRNDVQFTTSAIPEDELGGP